MQASRRGRHRPSYFRVNRLVALTVHGTGLIPPDVGRQGYLAVTIKAGIQRDIGGRLLPAATM